MLLSELNKQTGTQVSFDLKDVALTDAAIFEMRFFSHGTTTSR